MQRSLHGLLCPRLEGREGGTSPYTYQWYLNGNAVLGAFGSSWTFTPASTGSYTVYVIVTDGAGAHATSNTATIIPEFPSYVVLPIFMAATLLAALLVKRKRNTNRQSSQPVRYA